MGDRPLFTKIAVRLHLPAPELVGIFHRLGLDPEEIPTREDPWRHTRRSNQKLKLVFGPSGLRRVRAKGLVEQFTKAGYRYRVCELAVKPRQYDTCLHIEFVPEPERTLAAPAVMLDAFLATAIWKRGRVLIRCQKDDMRSAQVDLVLLKRAPPQDITELEFSPIRGFESCLVSPS